MTNNTKGWVIFAAAIGTMLGLMSGDIRALKSWDEMYTPTFIADMMTHMGVVIGAFVAGKMQPAKGEK